MQYRIYELMRGLLEEGHLLHDALIIAMYNHTIIQSYNHVCIFVYNIHDSMTYLQALTVKDKKYFQLIDSQ